ncbi:MAG TPA: hypothetical protein VHT96_06655 [Clostridia bacterium]|nr:hypothetical protein [Clostridia bacterium]
MNKKEFVEKDILNKNEELNVIQDEEVCSHEFSEGCILREEQA